MLLSLALIACQSELSGPVAVFDPGDDDFFATPWPSDARVTDQGAPDWSSFPNPINTPLLADYIDESRDRTGHALNAPLYVRFDNDIAIDWLPDTPEHSMSRRAPVQLVNVDPRSPGFGDRVPYQWEWRTESGNYHPAKLLAVQPIAGFPLDPRTTYALLVTTTIAQPDPDFVAAWDDPASGDWGKSLAVARSALPSLGMRPDDIAVATVFTTMDAVERMDHVARFLAERVTPPVFTAELEHLEDIGAYREYRSNYRTPIFMSGTPPYDTAGGEFLFRDDGFPLVQRWEPMRLSVVTPLDTSSPPAEGWPVLVSLHGTGGDYRSYTGTDSEFEIGQWMAEMGVVGISIDLPLHGARGTPDTIIDLHSFNVLQPESALHIHRQAAADLLYLLHGLREGPTFTTPEGEVITLDPNRIAVIGHSQGGITTALGLPWAGGMVRGAMMSGTGGLLAITAVERDTDYDFPEIIRQLLVFADGEELTELHPVLGLVQSLVEVTDPINYGRYWFAEDGGLAGAAPANVLMTSGLRDDQTPSRTSEALAAAANVPFVGPRFSRAPAAVMKGLDSQMLPVSDNAVGWTGELMTAGIAQYDSATHFAIFEEEDARDKARDFIRSVLFDDVPAIGVAATEQ